MVVAPQGSVSQSHRLLYSLCAKERAVGEGVPAWSPHIFKILILMLLNAYAFCLGVCLGMVDVSNLTTFS